MRGLAVVRDRRRDGKIDLARLCLPPVQRDSPRLYLVVMRHGGTLTTQTGGGFRDYVHELSVKAELLSMERVLLARAVIRRSE